MVAVVVGVILPGSDEESPQPGRQRPAEVLADNPSRPLNVRVDGTNNEGKVKVDQLSFDGFDGQRVPALLATPLDPANRRGCVIVQPQLGATKEAARGLWQG